MSLCDLTFQFKKYINKTLQITTKNTSGLRGSGNVEKRNVMRNSPIECYSYTLVRLQG